MVSKTVDRNCPSFLMVHKLDVGSTLNSEINVIFVRKANNLP